MKKVIPLEWKGQNFILVDQRKLPHDVEYVTVDTIEKSYDAIKDMVVRGAPLIGFTGIFGMALWIKASKNLTIDTLKEAAEYLKSARPTAVNLDYEINRVVDFVSRDITENKSQETIFNSTVDFGLKQIQILADDNLNMAKIAEKELKALYGERKYRLMTICNTGYLACGPMGTALGVVDYLGQKNMVEHVYASETRPYLQGSRLTAFELTDMGLSHEIFVEGAASYVLENCKVDAIFVGADRIVANGDTANKVGTSSLSIIAKNYGIPFFVVAPSSSFDTSMKTGKEIEIEMRDEKEILEYKNIRIAPLKSRAINPSFDVTKSNFITGIICEKGIVKSFNNNEIKTLLESK
jgi:methylthioribose-1-phosphate isomerase